MHRTPRFRLLAVLSAFLLLGAACAGETTTDDTTATPTDDMADDAMTEPTDGMTDDMATEDDMAMDDDMATEDDMAGDMAMVDVGCQVDLPADGPGSAEGMAQDPAGTAASNNPELSTLVAAATAAGLVDTLNDPEASYTIFAPANSAFAQIPESDLNALLADEAGLTEVLTYHVVGDQQMTLQELADAGSVATLQGGEVTVEASDPSTVMLNGMQAQVICADVETANATVHIIDGVLMPDMAAGDMGDMEADATETDG